MQIITLLSNYPSNYQSFRFLETQPAAAAPFSSIAENLTCCSLQLLQTGSLHYHFYILNDFSTVLTFEADNCFVDLTEDLSEVSNTNHAVVLFSHSQVSSANTEKL